MKKNINTSAFTIIASLLLLVTISQAQQKAVNVKRTNTDSLIRIIDNTIYNTYYNSNYWKKSIIPVFTVLKIDITETSNVKRIEFSDSADTLFTKELWRNPAYKNIKTALERYAKNKGYKNISILIPINYEPNYSPVHGVDYKHVESLMKFNGKDVIGKTILFSPVRIKVLSKGNI